MAKMHTANAAAAGVIFGRRNSGRGNLYMVSPQQPHRLGVESRAQIRVLRWIHNIIHN